MSLWEFFGIDFCSLFGIGIRPSHWRKRSTSEPCFDLRCDEFWDQPAGAGDKTVARRVEAAPGGLVAGRTWSDTDMPNSAQKVRPNNSQSDSVVHEFRSPLLPVITPFMIANRML
jgi:hypothetical protein